MRAIQPNPSRLGFLHCDIIKFRSSTQHSLSPAPVWQSPDHASPQFTGQQHTGLYTTWHEESYGAFGAGNAARKEILTNQHQAWQTPVLHRTPLHHLEQHRRDKAESLEEPNAELRGLADSITGARAASQRTETVNCSTLVQAYMSLLKHHRQQQQQAGSSSRSLVSTTEGSCLTVDCQSDSHWQHLLQQTETALRQQQLQPQQASLILYVVARLGRQSSPVLLQLLACQLQGQLQQLPPAGITNVVWALAVLDYQFSDPVDWFSCFYIASSSMLQPYADGGRWFNRHQLTSLLWCLGKLKQQPPAQWIETSLAALYPSLQQLSPTQLSNTIWALSQIGYRPHSAWCNAWFAAAYTVLTAFNTHHLACIVGSLGMLRLSTTNGRWLVQYRWCVQQQLLQMQPQQLATIMCGLAKRLSSQPPHWVTLLLRRQLQLLDQCPPPAQCAAHAAPQLVGSGSTLAVIQQQQQVRRTAAIAATVWALPRLLFPTAKGWASDPKHAALLRRLAAISLPLLPVCSAGELVQLAVGLAGLSYHPGTHWLKVHENAIASKYPQLDEQNKSRLRAAIRKLWLDG